MKHSVHCALAHWRGTILERRFDGRGWRRRDAVAVRLLDLPLTLLEMWDLRHLWHPRTWRASHLWLLLCWLGSHAMPQYREIVGREVRCTRCGRVLVDSRLWSKP